LHAGAAVKFHQFEIDSVDVKYVYLSVTINSAVKNCSAETSTNFDD